MSNDALQRRTTSTVDTLDGNAVLDGSEYAFGVVRFDAYRSRSDEKGK